jgi:hypothetical protein
MKQMENINLNKTYAGIPVQPEQPPVTPSIEVRVAKALEYIVGLIKTMETDIEEKKENLSPDAYSIINALLEDIKEVQSLLTTGELLPTKQLKMKLSAADAMLLIAVMNGILPMPSEFNKNKKSFPKHPECNTQ